MHVIVDVPIVPIRHYNDFDLYHYHSVPFLLGNQLVRVRSTDSLLAVNKDKSQFMEIFHSQLKGCLHLGKTVLCRYPGVIRAGAAQCCLLAVFEGNAEAIFKTCQLTFIMRAAPRRTESKERLRRLPISPVSTPELTDEEDEVEPVGEEPRIARVGPLC